MELFGFEFKRASQKETQQAFDIDREENADTNVVVARQGVDASLGVEGAGIQFAGIGDALVPRTEIELIEKYRQMAIESEVDQAIQEIKNEVFVFDEPGKRAFDLNFEDTDKAPSENIQKKILEEFSYLYDLMDFDTRGQKYFEDWYVDGRIYLHKIIDSNNPRAGIKKVMSLDPMDIRKIRIYPKKGRDGTFDITKTQEFYLFAKNMQQVYKKASLNNFSGYNELQSDLSVQGLRIHPDTITYAPSGLYDKNSDMVISYLYNAIKPFNRLKMAEDAMLIFRVVRAPQRRAIYVDVGGLPTNKADDYMQKLAGKFRNKMVYDNKTGSLNNSTNIQSMLEDYWLPRRDGGRGTEIQTLDGQSTQDMLEEVGYYRDKLWDALRVPKSRFVENGGVFNFGRDTQVSRDEYRFTKFLSLLRRSFLVVMEDLIKTQIILKKIITEDEWAAVRRSFFWTFTEDNMFVEIKDNESLQQKLAILGQVEPYIGKYFSPQQVRTQILRQSDEEQKLIDEQNSEWEKLHPKTDEDPFQRGNQ